jgi:hypothetical protein
MNDAVFKLFDHKVSRIVKTNEKDVEEKEISDDEYSQHSKVFQYRYMFCCMSQG